jgi:hypothetical protein
MLSKIVGGLIIVQAMATVICGNMEAVPRGKVIESKPQLMMGFVERSHDNPRTIDAEGCNFVTRSEMSCEEESPKVRLVVIYSWMKPLVAGFPSNRQSAMGMARGVQARPGREEKALSMKFEVAPESMRVGMGSARPGSCTWMMNEESEWESIAAKRDTGGTEWIVSVFEEIERPIVNTTGEPWTNFPKRSLHYLR